MRVKSLINRSRLIVDQRMVWLQVCIISMVYCSANAQSATGTESSQYGRYNFDPTTASILLVVIFAFTFFGAITFFLRYFSDPSSLPLSSSATTLPGDHQMRRRGLDSSVIGTLPVFAYSVIKEIKIGREALECAVCLSEFGDDESLRLLPKCSHVFHPECIDMWLASHVTCPVCRADLSKPQPPPPPPQEEPQNPPTSPGSLVESRTGDEVVITVDEDRNGDSMVTDTWPEKNQLPRTGPISGKFPRSHSTGHSLVQPGESAEKYTLRLPEQMRREIMDITKLQRARSFNVVLVKEGSSSSSSSSSRGSRWDRWVLLKTPPFGFSGGSAVKSCKGESDGGDGSVNARTATTTLLASVKVPLHCLGGKVDGGGEEAYNRVSSIV